MKLTFYIRKFEFSPNQMLLSWELRHPHALCDSAKCALEPEWTLARPSVGSSLHHT